MAKFPYKTALIAGAGPGISAALARHFLTLGVAVGLAEPDVVIYNAGPRVSEIVGFDIKNTTALQDARLRMRLFYIFRRLPICCSRDC